MRSHCCSLLTVAALLITSVDAMGQSGGSADVNWRVCPCTESLGTEATVTVPAGFEFTDAAGARKVLEAMENPTNGTERGMVLRREGEDFWFAVFEYDETGYVKDDEKEELDADAVLASLRAGNDKGNEERRRRGWTEVLLRGWHHQPHYDSVTNNLTWSMRVGSPVSSEEWVNHSVRLLGRSGTMKVDLVADMDEVAAALPHFEQVVRGFSFAPGNRYTEFRPGDKIAEYGLTALIAGGAGVVAAKSGLFSKLGKFAVYLFIAALALLKGLWSRLTRKEETEPSTVAASGEPSSDGPRDGWH